MLFRPVNEISLSLSHVTQLRIIMCVPGLILNPEVPIYAVFTSPFSVDHSVRSMQESTAPLVHSATAPTYPPTTIDRRDTLLDRKGTILNRIRNFYGNAARLFARSSPCVNGYNFPATLAGASAAASSATLINPAPPARKRADTNTTLIEKTTSMSSTPVAPTMRCPPAQKQELLVLPFQFSMRLASDVTPRRNLSCLRHS